MKNKKQKKIIITELKEQTVIISILFFNKDLENTNLERADDAY